MSDVLELPFDQYQRYRLTADLLSELRGKGPPLEVLDVGGRTALLRAFLPRERVTLVDVEASRERGLVLGSGAALPFRDGAFDAVCAFDTLEHVPPDLRGEFVAECARVARRWVLLAGPYDAPPVVEAERVLQRFLREKLAVEHRYLNEHRHNGLPVRADVEAELARLGGVVQSFAHANLERWLVAMCLSLYLDEDPALRPLARAFHRFYNRELYRSDHAEPAYRHVVVAALRGAPLPTAAGLLDEPRAPRGALAPFVGFAQDIALFDRERTAWREERERFRAVVADLERDLAGHAGSIGDRESELAVQRTAIRALEAELARTRATFAREIDAHRVVIAERQSEVHKTAAAFHDQATAHAAVLADRDRLLRERERDLAEHHALARELTVELERVRGHRDQLESELRRVEGVAADIQRELVGSHENAARLAAIVEAERAVSAGLRAQLRDRWTNLKRALSWKSPGA